MQMQKLMMVYSGDLSDCGLFGDGVPGSRGRLCDGRWALC